MSKEEIVEKARDSSADEEVMTALEGIADRQYENPTEVSEQLGEDG